MSAHRARTLIQVGALIVIMIVSIGGQRLISARSAARLADDLAAGVAGQSAAEITAAVGAAESRVGTWTLVLLCTGGALIMLLVLALTRGSVRNQVAPLRVTTQEIVASGDHSLRLRPSGRGEIAALAVTINAMLDVLAENAEQVEAGQRDRERRIIEAHRTRIQTEAQLRERSQARIDETVAAVSAELRAVLGQVDEVRSAADDIDRRARDGEAVTTRVLDEAAGADRVLGELTASVTEVNGIVQTIQAITEQTRMLALNATIEAARAGQAGAGFSVVADQVGLLAADTARSAGGIAATTSRVGQSVGRVSGTLATLSAGVGEVGQATDRVRAVAESQHSTVDALTAALNQAIERVEAMGALTDDLERRSDDRYPAFGTVVVEHAGRSLEARLRDVSKGGMELGLSGRAVLTEGSTVYVTLPEELGSARVQLRVEWSRHEGDEARAGLACLDKRDRLAEQTIAWAQQFHR